MRLLFEDLYVYANKYHKDAAARSAKPVTKTLADIARGNTEINNKASGVFIPYPGEQIIINLGECFTSVANTKYLLDQLYSNPITNYNEETKEKISFKLHKIEKLIQSISSDLDQYEQKDETE
jgi:hypothetical protein